MGYTSKDYVIDSMKEYCDDIGNIVTVTDTLVQEDKECNGIDWEES